jgi:AAA domain, putative AbiEii toxin, Type IV TA system/AAA ATPase domain
VRLPVLTSISLRNYKAHQSLDLKDLPAFVVLVGENNSGKSSILHAAGLPKYGLKSHPTFPSFSFESLTGDGPEGLVELQYSGAKTSLKLHLPQSTSDGNVRVEYAGTTKSVNRLSAPLVHPEPAAALRSFYLSGYRAPPPERFQYERFTGDVGLTGQATWNELHQLKANDNAAFQEVLNVAAGMALRLDAIRTPTTYGGDPGAGEIHPRSFGTEVNIPFMGSGTGSVFPILVQAALAKPGDTLLIEEPETHLHRAAIDKLVEFLASKAHTGIQTICTTHSLDFAVSFFDRRETGKVPTESKVYLIERDKAGKSSAKSIDPDPSFRPALNQLKQVLAGRPTAGIPP